MSDLTPVVFKGERLGWQKCETCGGRGFWSEWHQTNEANGKQTYHDCPDCVDGWTPPAELVERAAEQLRKALESPSLDELPSSYATRAVLLEQARWIGEQ